MNTSSNSQELSLGQKRVRVSFNPSNESIIDTVKGKTAELIDIVDNISVTKELSKEDTGEFFRLRALAMTAYEEAAMWAVKAATI